MTATPEQWFTDLLATSPSQPFVTYYDEATGERSELSVKSLANWVAKTHHLLGTELGLGVGNRALLALPAHWISIAPLLGVLTAGLEIVDDSADADVAFVSPESFAAAVSVPDIYAIAPSSAAVGFKGAEPSGANDSIVAVRPQADTWGSVQFGAGPTDMCLDSRTRAEVASWTLQRVEKLGLTPGARVLTDRDWNTAYDLVDTVLAPLAVGGSVVFVRNADEETLQRRVDQERATHRIR